MTEDSLMYAGEFALSPEFIEGAERLQAVQGHGEVRDSGGCIENASGLNRLDALMCGPENPFSALLPKRDK